MSKKQHGGQREGAGRPRKEETVVIRIPKALKDHVEDVVRLYYESKEAR